MRTIAVDDEPWMLKRFEMECESLPDVQLLGCFRNPLSALDYARCNRVELAFLDVEMPEMDGLTLAMQLRKILPEVIIIFVSAYDQYMSAAFRTKSADYYIMKPYDHADMSAAVERARLLSGRLRKSVCARTFGRFELLLNNQPIPFDDPKAKELLALLVSHRGGILTAVDACRALWPAYEPNDGQTQLLCNQTLTALQRTLQNAGLSGIVERNHDGLLLHTDAVECDLLQYIDGSPRAMREFSGAYMTGYDWADEERAFLTQQSRLLERYTDAQVRNTLCASIRVLSDPPLTLTYVNEGFLAIIGYTRKELEERFHNSLRALILREDFDKVLARGRELLQSGKPLEVEYRLRSRDDNEIWVMSKSERPIPYRNSALMESASILIDISGLKTEQQKLEQSAQHDGLTGLFNRATAQEKICRYLAEQGEDCYGALILMDVDHFKAVNDTYGHPFADTVLTDVAAILQRSFRVGDIVGRLGGDEMIIFLKGIKTAAAAKTTLAHMTDRLAERLHAKTPRGELSCSFGGVLCPEDGNDFETLYRKADLALYAAKETRGTTVWFSAVRMQLNDKLVAREVTAIDSRPHDTAPALAPVELPAVTDDTLFSAIESLLRDLGMHYDVSRVYIFELSADQQTVVNTFEWCAAGIRPERQNLQALPFATLSAFFQLLEQNDGLFYCFDVRNLSAPLLEIIEPQGIKSMLHYALQQDGRIFGIVGFDECRHRRYWSGEQIRTLANFANALATALSGYRECHSNTPEQLQGRRNIP